MNKLPTLEQLQQLNEAVNLPGYEEHEYSSIMVEDQKIPLYISTYISKDSITCSINIKKEDLEKLGYDEIFADSGLRIWSNFEKVDNPTLTHLEIIDRLFKPSDLKWTDGQNVAISEINKLLKKNFDSIHRTIQKKI